MARENREMPGLPISRRGFLRLSAIATVPLLAACASQPTASPTTVPPPGAATQPPTTAGTKPPAPGATSAPAPTAVPAPAIKRGGSLVTASTWTYPTLDTHLNTTSSGLIGYDSMYNALVRYEENPATKEYEVVGELAESWEQPDPLTLDFHLRKGVKFHDGSDFDAEVAAWNLKRAREHPKSHRKDQLAAVASATALNKDTVRLKFKAPSPSFIPSFAYFAGAQVEMVSKAAHDKGGDDGIALNPVGTGPFKFKQWVTDDRLITVRNPDYFENGVDGKPLPYLDECVNRYIPDGSVAVVELRAGSVHLVERLPSSQDAIARADAKVATIDMPWGGEVFFYGGFNTTAPPFNDVRLRKAAQYAIDRAGMAKALGFGIGVPYLYGEWAEGCLGWDPNAIKYDYNPARVKELLTEAGYPDGIDIEILVIAREPERTIAEFVQQNWTSVGLRTKLRVLERLAANEAALSMDFQVFFWRGGLNWTSIDPEIARLRWYTGAAGNWDSLSDPDVDRLMDEGASEMDPKKRHETYRQLMSLMQERAYRFSGFLAPRVHAYRKEVEGVTLNYLLPSLRKAHFKA